MFDALVLPRHLPRLKVLIERHPDLAVVVDHGAKPRIRDGLREPWASDLAAIAGCAGVTCKLSGSSPRRLPTGAYPTFGPMRSRSLQPFGPQRVMFGSDWPVVNLAGGYARWREAALDLIQDFSVPERAAILGDTAERVYLSGAGDMMLKGIDPLLSADLLWILAAMGHGDDLAIVDGNHPAETIARATTSGRLVRLPGVTMERAVSAILTVLPIDDFTDRSGAPHAVVGKPDEFRPCSAGAGRDRRAQPGAPPLAGIERHAFYAAARGAFAVVQCVDPRPYGCFLVRKGVIAG